MDWSQTSRHNSPSNCSTFSERENDAENSLELNYVRRRFIDTYTIKVERDVPESCDEQMRNDDTNLQEIKLEPQFCIVDENDLMEENHRAAGPDVKIKTEVEDTAADESSSNLHHVPFASIDNENLQDEDPLQNEITSELIIKSEHELSVVGESRDNGNYSHDVSEDAEKKSCAESVNEIGRQVDAGCAGDRMSTHTCQICDRVFQRESYFFKHLNKHKNNEINDKGLYECEVCKKEFQEACILLRHKKTHLNTNPLKCMQSEGQFKNTKQLIPHVDNEHQSVGSFQCSQCSKYFKTKSHLGKHLKVHSDVRPFKCDKCSKSFKHKHHLITHSKVHIFLQQFKCQECSKKFKFKSNLRDHITKIHSDEYRLFACIICDKKFTSKYDVLRHNLIHSDVRPFACKVCGKMFKTNSNLQGHKKTHNILKPFHCEKCSISFKLQRHLSSHMLVHSDMRPFSCDICAKTFKSKRGLKVHGVIHSTSYDFKCNLCIAKFRCKRYLIYHMKNFHCDARPFTCNECGKWFIFKSDLKDHIARYLKLCQFRCGKCDQSFNCKIHLVTQCSSL